MNSKTCSASRAIKTGRVLPPDTNNHQTLFGGKLMAYIDDIASISAAKHCRMDCVTASTDSVDFLEPIRPTDAITLESFVSHTGYSSMEVFVKVEAEDLFTGNKRIAATSFLTFVALDEVGKPTEVPSVVPETQEEIFLYETADERAAFRKKRKSTSKELASFLINLNQSKT